MNSRQEAAPSPAPDRKPDRPPAPAARSDPLPEERPSILVVDDEEDLLQIFAEFLEGEFRLELARTGTEAIAKLGPGRFDVIVTDLNLPGADGLEILRCSKAADPQAEVIVLTGNASTLTAIEALRQGAYDYVLKPFDLFEMDQTVRKALERRRLLAENRQFVDRLYTANVELTTNQEALRRHRDELKRMVEEATLRIRTLYEVGKEITSSLHLDRTLRLILDRSCELTRAAEGVIFLLDETSGELECRVSRGLDRESAVPEDRVRALEAPNAEVRRERRPSVVLIGKSEAGAREALVVPLLQEGEVAGTIAVLSRPAEEFNADDRELLVSLAAQASIAIHNARVYGKIRDLDRMKSEFVAVVSHEVRTPLTSIKGTLEILADQKYFPVGPEQNELLGICRANVDRLEALIDDILDFSKLESSRLSTHFIRTSMANLLENVVVNISKQAERKRIRLVTESAPRLPEIVADELRIIQVMNNLIANAIKFSPEGTEIRIRASRPDQEEGVLVEICDHGIGIAPDDLPKLFTRFRQLDSSSTRKAGGTGLGLVISKGIIEEHGGRIWAESTPGQGSSFYFFLPIGDHAGETGSTVAESKSEMAPSRS